MIDMQAVKFVNIAGPVAITDDGSWTTASIDTKGWDYLTVIVRVGATDIAMTALKLQSSDTDSSYADVTGLVFGTSTATSGSASTLPSATDDNTFRIFHVDLRGQKRYFDLVATAGDGATGTYLYALGILSRGEIGPDSASEQGAAEVLMI